LHLEGFLKQIALLEMINDEIEEVDMHYPAGIFHIQTEINGLNGPFLPDDII